MRSGVVDTKAPRSEKALADVDRVAGKDGVGCDDASGHHLAVDIARHVDIGLVGAWGEPAGYGDGLLGGQARNVGILSSRADFARFLDEQFDTWGRVIRERNIRAD